MEQGKGRGPVRLRYELAEKGIDAATIQEALEACIDSSKEKDAAWREAVKLLKYRNETGCDPAGADRCGIRRKTDGAG